MNNEREDEEVPLSSRELWLIMRARDEASRAVRGLGRELTMTGAAAQAAAARAQAATLRQQAAMMKHTGATNDQINAVRRSAQAYDDQARSIMQSARRTEYLSAAFSQAGQAMLTVGAGLIAVGAGTLYALGSTVKAAQEYDRQVRLTQTQVDGFKASLDDLLRIGLRTANAIAVPFKEIQPALYDIFSSTNANLKQAEILLTGFSKAAVAGQVSIQAASRATMAIMNAYNIPLEDVNKVLDIQFQLVRKGVGTYAEFAGVVGNVIPSSTRAGQSFEMVAAMLAYLTRNGLSASMAATSAARALEAMSNPKTVGRLKAMGIDAYDAAGKMRPLTDILGELRTKLYALPPAERVGALLDLLKGAGSTVQARRFLEQVLLRPGELEEFIGYLGDMSHASGQFEKAYGTMSNSVAAKSQLLKNQWDVLKVQVGNIINPYFSKFLTALTKLLGAFNALPEGTRKNIVLFTALSAALAIVGGLLLVFVGGVSLVIAGFMAAGAGIVGFVAGFVALAAGIGVAIVSLVALYQRSENVRNLVNAVKDNLVQFGEIVKNFALGVWQAFEQYVLPSLRKLWNVIEMEVLPRVKAFYDKLQEEFIPKIREAARILKDLAEGALRQIGDVIENIIIPAIKSMTKWWDDHKAEIEKLLPIFAQVAKWLLIIAGIITGVLLVALVSILGTAIMLAVGTFMSLVYAIGIVIDYFQRLWSQIKVAGSVMKGFYDDTILWTARAIAWLSDLPGRIIAFFVGAGTWLWNAGRNIIQGLINGLDSMIGSLKSKLGSITNMIPDVKGPPAKDLRLLVAAGRNIMTGFMRGIDSQIPALRAQLQGVTTDIQTSGGNFADTKPPAPPGFSSTSAPSGNTYNNTFNITTTSSDPKAVATELGWQIENRLGV